MESSLRCEISNVDVHRASMQKHLRSEKHSEKETQGGINIPEWLLKEEQAPMKNQKKTYTTLKQ